jgi:deazaflavin-dependent oxidoreductase (nitroreductase family)
MFDALPITPRVVTLVHRGRRTGKLYETPLSILVEHSERNELIVSPMWSTATDWYRNLLAGGLVEVRVRGERWQVDWRDLDVAERRAAGEAFRDAHPTYSRLILRLLARLNRFEGDPYEAVLQNLPMLSLRRA